MKFVPVPNKAGLYFIENLLPKAGDRPRSLKVIEQSLSKPIQTEKTCIAHKEREFSKNEHS